MARSARPWYCRQTKSWKAYIDGRKVPLLKGPKDASSRRQAGRVLDDLLDQKVANPALGAAEPTVASIIEAYLGVAKYSERALSERRYYLQLFAEHCGWKTVREARRHDLTTFLAANPQWKSDWTLAQVVNIVQRPFNWAVNEERAERNPFKGITHGQGSPRRPMTREEFVAVLRATRTRHSRKRPTSGARFRYFLYFLWYTGARPGEAGKLKWSDIDLEGAVIVLHEHKTTRTQRVKVPRVIPLDPFLVRLLVKVRRQGDPGDLAFLTHRKTPWNRSNLSLRVQRAREIAGSRSQPGACRFQMTPLSSRYGTDAPALRNVMEGGLA